MVAPQSLDQASVLSVCFLEEFTDYDMLMDPREGTDDVTSYDVDEMDMIGIGRILDIAPHKPHSALTCSEFLYLRLMEQLFMMLTLMRWI